MCDALIYAPDGDFLHLEETVACIEKDDAQRFLVEGPHFSGHQVVNQFGGVKLLPRQAFIREALAEAEGSHKLDRLGCSDTTNRCDFPYGASAQTGKGAVPFQKLASDLNRVGSWHTGPE